MNPQKEANLALPAESNNNLIMGRIIKEDPWATPGGVKQILLHACCAPCSGAIVEAMKARGLEPVIFYCNPNIYPLDEYEKRRDECRRFAREMEIGMVESPYDHDEWLNSVAGLENEPERGRRCQRCFAMRLKMTAHYAAEHGYSLIATTLASSRWKSLEQIAEAGKEAQETTGGKVIFWDRNWRKGGLQERRNEIIRERGFYTQLYCGCEFSKRQ